MWSFLLNARPLNRTNRFSTSHTLTKAVSLDLKQIKQIIELMKRSELTEFAVEEEGFKLKIRRGTNGLPLVSTGPGSNSPFPGAERTSPATPGPTPAVVPAPAAAADETGVTYIKSPMVG